ncbi:MAG: DUF2179 domain-containing protein [Candidatus Aminicenantaceae bacterium]
MSFESIIGSEAFKWGVLPLLIFAARVLDVSLGTIRIVFVSRGLKLLAPLIGFFEVIIWLLAIRVIMQNLNNVACYIAYGAGFALGTYIGIQIEKRLAIGNSIVQIITRKNASDLIEYLRAKGYGITSMDAQGSTGKVHVIYIIIKRQDLKEISKIIKRFHPKAFYTVEELGIVSEGIFPKRKYRSLQMPIIGLFSFWRKGK